MRGQEYEIMAQVECDHWWYRGLRSVLFRTLHANGIRLRANPRIVDAGCGTGETLRFLTARLRPSYVGGFDASELAVDWSRRKNPRADIYRSDLRDPEIRTEEIDLAISMDVLETTGIGPVLPGLQAISRRLAPGGVFAFNVAALNWLRSEHDVAVDVTQRFTLGEVGAMLGALQLRPVVLTYRVFFLFPIVVAMRLPSILGKKPPPAEARSDLHISGGLLNPTLSGIMELEADLIARGVRFPIGSSVFAVGARG